MTSARTPLPTDLVALVSFDGRVYPNEAHPLDRVGLEERASPLESALEQWFSFATGKHTWVSVHGATIRGLISARKRTKGSAWEVEVLINATDDEAVALSLFSRMTAGVLKQGAERVFLRMRADSELHDTARSAGFFRYQTETLYRRAASTERPDAGSDVALRSKGKDEAFALYQLYDRLVPANVRAIEGVTFKEWQAAQEKWGGRTTDLMVDQDGVICGWLRVGPRDVGRLYAIAEGLSYDALVAAGIEMMPDRDVLCLVPEYNVELASALERLGFVAEADYWMLAKRLAKTVEELTPEKATIVVSG